MDLPRSHITPDLALRSANDRPAVFPAYPRLPQCALTLLEDQRRKAFEQRSIATACVLARLASSDAAAGLVRELKRHNTSTGDYFRPTVDALLWRDPRLRKLLPVHLLPSYHCAAREENSWRACLVILLLAELAKLATHPDERAVAKVAGPLRTAVEEWQTAEALRAYKLPDDAAAHMRRADMYLCYAKELAREWTPDVDELLRVICWRLARHFGCKCYRIAAALVSAAVTVPISRRQARYAVEAIRK